MYDFQGYAVLDPPNRLGRGGHGYDDSQTVGAHRPTLSKGRPWVANILGGATRLLQGSGHASSMVTMKRTWRCCMGGVGREEQEEEESSCRPCSWTQ